MPGGLIRKTIHGKEEGNGGYIAIDMALHEAEPEAHDNHHAGNRSGGMRLDGSGGIYIFVYQDIKRDGD